MVDAAKEKDLFFGVCSVFRGLLKTFLYQESLIP